MKLSIWLIGMFGLLLSGIIWWSKEMAMPLRQPLPGEAWVDANHVRVQIKGVWRDIQLMPLADHLCNRRQPLFQRYCNDPSSYRAR